MGVHMKRMSATSSRKRRVLLTRLSLVSLAFVLAVATPLAPVQQALADKWDRQIASLQKKADEYQAQANELRAKGDTLQNKLNQINAQIRALQTRIKANQQKRDKLQADIEANQKKLTSSQEVLGEILADLYVDDTISDVELFASSNNIGDFVDKQEYRSSIRDQLNTVIADVKRIKEQLETDKKAVDKVLAELKVQNNQLAAQQNEQQRLVDQTRGKEAAYQRLVSQTKDKIAAAAAAQRAYLASLGGSGGTVGNFHFWGWSGNQGCGGGGYPYCAGPLDYGVDPWGLYTRECVSYAAWALAKKYNKYVGHFSGSGMAHEWTWSGPLYSGAYRVSNPQRGDAVVLPIIPGFADVGHLMMVEAVDGDNVFVSQYNFGGTGEYSTMWIKKSGVVFLRFPNA